MYQGVPATRVRPRVLSHPIGVRLPESYRATYRVASGFRYGLLAFDSPITESASPEADSSPAQGIEDGHPAEPAEPPPDKGRWGWISRYAKIEDRISSAFDPAVRRLLGLAAFMGLWTYWMPGFAKPHEYFGQLVVIPIFIYYGVGVGALSWGLWHLFRERFPWDD